MTPGYISLSSRPHLYTAETRLGDALDTVQSRYPHCENAFRRGLAALTGLDYYETAPYWRMWRHTVSAQPFTGV